MVLRTISHQYRSLLRRSDVTKSNKRMPICKVYHNKVNSVAITINVSFGADNINKILSILKKHNAKATFFVSGIWVDSFTDKLEKIIESGCEIMNLSDTYPIMTQCRTEDVLEQIESCNRKIKAVVGVSPTYFRCPLGYYDKRILKCINYMGMKVIQWSVDGLDNMETSAAEEIYYRIMSQIEPGGIILLHNASRYTPSALDRVLISLTEKGYRFAKVSELISDM